MKLRLNPRTSLCGHVLTSRKCLEQRSLFSPKDEGSGVSQKRCLVCPKVLYANSQIWRNSSLFSEHRILAVSAQHGSVEVQPLGCAM